MKKIGISAMAFLLSLVLLVGCGGNQGQSQSSGDSGKTTFEIAGMKGPTTMGMVELMDKADKGTSKHDYNVTMYGTSDAIVPKLVSGELDIAAVPCNLASVLYNQTGGKVQVVAVNTLGVLYIVENGDTIQSIQDLKGKTIYSTGKGTTPEYVFRYVLSENGIDPDKDLKIEFKSESTEIAALMAGGEDIIALLPEPYITTVQAQNDKVRIALDMTKEWDKVSESGLVTGVLVARKAFIEENKTAFDEFLAEYKESCEYAVNNVDDAAELIVKYEIVPALPVAKTALPKCNITFESGPQMKKMVSGYLEVLLEQNAASIGGEMPGEDFYYGA